MLGKAKSFRLSLKGGRGAVVTFRKSNKRGGLFFSGKAWKERFSFREKHIRDGFNVTFSLVRKSNQKVPQRAAALWTPGERFKIPSGGLLAKPQAMYLSENFYENLQPCAIPLGVF